MHPVVHLDCNTAFFGRYSWIFTLQLPFNHSLISFDKLEALQSFQPEKQ